MQYIEGMYVLSLQACILWFVEYTYMKWQPWQVASESDCIVKCMPSSEIAHTIIDSVL